MTIYPVPKPGKKQKKSKMSVSEFKATVETESVLQRQCEEYLNVRGIQFIRMPDSAYKAIFANPNLKSKDKSLISSFIKGLPDITILEPITDEYCLSCCIELKSAKGKLSQGQKNFGRRVPVKVVRSFEQFESEVNKFMREVEKFKELESA